MACLPFFTREQLREIFSYLDDFERNGRTQVARHYLQGDFGLDNETADYLMARWEAGRH